MHIYYNQKDMPVAWVPNSLIMNIEKTKNVYSHRIIRSIFTYPLSSISNNNGVVEIKISLITTKKIKGSTCTTILNACKDVMKTQIEIKGKTKNNFELINVFSSVVKNGSVLRLKLNNDAITALIKHQSMGFTKISFDKYLKLDTMYETKWFEILSKITGYKKAAVLELSSLKSNLGANKLKQWDNFKRIGLNAPFEGINKKLGTSISYKPVIIGRKTCAIEVYNKNGGKLIPIKNINKSSTVTKKQKLDDKIHDHACSCFSILPKAVKEKYINRSKWFSDEELKQLNAIDIFKTENYELLKSNTPEEVIRVIKMQTT